jgi:hypothetical protein
VEQLANVHLAQHQHHPRQHHRHHHPPAPLVVLGRAALPSVVIAAQPAHQEVILRAVDHHRLAQVHLHQLRGLPLCLLHQLLLLGHVQAPLPRILLESVRMLSARTIISSSLVIGVFHAHRERGPMPLVGVSKRWQT